MLLKAEMNLRKWNSNSIELMRRIQVAESTSEGTCVQVPTEPAITEEEESYAKSVFSVQSCTEGLSLTKLLGLLWDIQADHFTFEFSKLEEYACSLPANCRSLLKVTAKIFDPLGFFSPFVIQLKVLFQTLCVEGLGWDQPLGGELLKFWNSLLNEFKALNVIRIL